MKTFFSHIGYIRKMKKNFHISHFQYPALASHNKLKFYKIRWISGAIWLHDITPFFGIIIVRSIMIKVYIPIVFKNVLIFSIASAIWLLYIYVEEKYGIGSQTNIVISFLILIIISVYASLFFVNKNSFQHLNRSSRLLMVGIVSAGLTIVWFISFIIFCFTIFGPPA
jgi:hypothetical protein